MLHCVFFQCWNIFLPFEDGSWVSENQPEARVTWMPDLIQLVIESLHLSLCFAPSITENDFFCHRDAGRLIKPHTTLNFLETVCKTHGICHAMEYYRTQHDAKLKLLFLTSSPTDSHMTSEFKQVCFSKTCYLITIIGKQRKKTSN